MTPGITAIIKFSGPVTEYYEVCDESEPCVKCEGSGFVIGTETQESKGTLCDCAAGGEK